MPRAPNYKREENDARRKNSGRRKVGGRREKAKKKEERNGRSRDTNKNEEEKWVFFARCGLVDGLEMEAIEAICLWLGTRLLLASRRVGY